MKITVVGAGAWGTAVATHAAQQHEVSLWARTADEAQPILAYGENQRYLPGIQLPAMHIRSGTPQPTDVAEQDLVIIATPVAGLRHQLQALRGSQVPVVWLCKGFEQAQAGETDGLLPHEVMQQVAPDLQAGVLSGPSFALEVARQQPTALVAASPSQLVRDRAVAVMHGGNMRAEAFGGALPHGSLPRRGKFLGRNEIYRVEDDLEVRAPHGIENLPCQFRCRHRVIKNRFNGHGNAQCLRAGQYLAETFFQRIQCLPL